MKVAIVSPGPIRSFSLCYQSWVKKLIVPLENTIGKDNVKVFMYNSIITDEVYEKELKDSIFNTKLGTDTDGWQEIFENSPYITYHDIYKYNDKYIEEIFNEINEFNGTNYNPYSLKKYTKFIEKKNFTYKSYYMLIQGICLNYNNKKLIDLVPDKYDLIIKIRPDVFLVEPYPIKELLQMKENTIYLQVKKHKGTVRTLQKKLLDDDNFVLGKRWDNFYMGHTKTLKQLYSNLFSLFNLHINNFITKPLLQEECIPEWFFQNIILSEKIMVDKYFYHGVADKRFIIPSTKKNKRKLKLVRRSGESKIKFARKNRFNWFIMVDDNCTKKNLVDYYSK